MRAMHDGPEGQRWAFASLYVSQRFDYGRRHLINRGPLKRSQGDPIVIFMLPRGVGQGGADWRSFILPLFG
jgi:hypothetical protein